MQGTDAAYIYSTMENFSACPAVCQRRKATGRQTLPRSSIIGVKFSITNLGETVTLEFVSLAQNEFRVTYIALNQAANLRVAIQEGITYLGEYALSNLYNMTEATLPGTLTSIGESAFQSSYDLVHVTIPNSVTSIGKAIFSAAIYKA